MELTQSAIGNNTSLSPVAKIIFSNLLIKDKSQNLLECYEIIIQSLNRQSSHWCLDTLKNNVLSVFIKKLDKKHFDKKRTAKFFKNRSVFRNFIIYAHTAGINSNILTQPSCSKLHVHLLRMRENPACCKTRSSTVKGT